MKATEIGIKRPGDSTELRPADAVSHVGGEEWVTAKNMLDVCDQ
jgi:hypothetical protein